MPVFSLIFSPSVSNSCMVHELLLPHPSFLSIQFRQQLIKISSCLSFIVACSNLNELEHCLIRQVSISRSNLQRVNVAWQVFRPLGRNDFQTIKNHALIPHHVSPDSFFPDLFLYPAFQSDTIWCEQPG